MYTNLNNPVNYQLQDFGQFGFRVLDSTSMVVDGETYRTLYVVDDAVVSATTSKGDDLVSKPLLSGTLLHGLFSAPTVASGKVLAYMAGRLTAEEILELYTAYLTAIAGTTLENTDCLYDDLNQMGADTYADASLVLIPSGYSTGVVYGQRPLDSNSQITFTRASDATRVINGGLIEKVRTNVVTYSQDFNDASWTKTALTISTSATANPVNGALTAQDAIPTAVLSSHRFLKISGVASSLNTWSIYAKAKGYNFITIVENGNTSANVSFNLSTGTIGQQNSATGRIESLGNGWYRCSMIHTTSTTPRFDVYVSPTDSIASYTADGTSGVTLFGAQLEAGDIATDYIETGASAVSVGPVSNVPRIDYTGGGCGKLLLEPQRTNYQLYSENSSQWSTPADGLTVVYNTSETIDPSGYYGAEKVTSASGNKRMFNGLTNPSGALTMSAFVKKGTGDEFLLRTTSSSVLIQYNLTTLAVTATAGTGTITNYGNGWYRVTASTSSAIANEVARYQFPNADGEYMYFWGAMVENGAYATSYIPTLGAAVTRGADACSKTGISSLIGQTEGTLFLDVRAVLDTANNQDYSVSDATANNRALIRLNTSGLINAIGVFGGSTEFNMGTTPYTAGSRYKIALAYKLNDIALYVNGVQAATDNLATISGTLSRFGFDVGTGIAPITSPVNKALLFKKRLSNDELAALTTL